MRTLLFLLLFIAPLLSFSQALDSTIVDTSRIEDNFKIRYKSTVISIPYRKVRDEGHSPLTHRGPSFQIAAYNERWRTRNGINTSITKFEMVLGVGIIKTSRHKVNSVTSAPTLYMEVNYHYMRPVRNIFGDRGKWYIGAILTNTFDGRYYTFLPNNSFGYEFSNVINPATQFTYNFDYGKAKRSYQAGFKMNFALLAHVVRPNYIGMEPAETYMDEKIKPFAIFTHGNQIVLPNRFFRINTEIYLDRFKKTGHDKFRIFYGWGLHVTKLQHSNPLYVASHTVGIVSMLYQEKKRKNRVSKKTYSR
jgi:hypothetical protein